MMPLEHFMPGDQVLVTDTCSGESNHALVTSAFIARDGDDPSVPRVGYGMRASKRGENRFCLCGTLWHDTCELSLVLRKAAARSLYAGRDGELPVRLGYRVASNSFFGDGPHRNPGYVVRQMSLLGCNFGPSKSWLDQRMPASDKAVMVYLFNFTGGHWRHVPVSPIRMMRTIPSFYLALQRTGDLRIPPELVSHRNTFERAANAVATADAGWRDMLC